jgi:hypothetical protein
MVVCGDVAKHLSNRKGEGKLYTITRSTARYRTKKRFNSLAKKEPRELENGQINTVNDIFFNCGRAWLRNTACGLKQLALRMRQQTPFQLPPGYACRPKALSFGISLLSA